ncbi:MAG TPA: hypothetical protein VHA30_00920 [Patescibacteria group bacterium]|nr:hypothetical protein [Patescibacteria group bacterium]
MEEKEIRRAVKKLEAEAKKFKFGQRPELLRSKRQDLGPCPACSQGTITLFTAYSREFRPETGEPILGPGAEAQYRTVEHTSCHCSNCGAMYDEKTFRAYLKRTGTGRFTG